MASSMILLPLRPDAKKKPKHKIICVMRPTGRKDRLIDLKMFFLEYNVCVISVAVV